MKDKIFYKHGGLTATAARIRTHFQTDGLLLGATTAGVAAAGAGRRTTGTARSTATRFLAHLHADGFGRTTATRLRGTAAARLRGTAAVGFLTYFDV